MICIKVWFWFGLFRSVQSISMIASASIAAFSTFAAFSAASVSLASAALALASTTAAALAISFSWRLDNGSTEISVSHPSLATHLAKHPLIPPSSPNSTLDPNLSSQRFPLHPPFEPRPPLFLSSWSHNATSSQFYEPPCSN